MLQGRRRHRAEFPVAAIGVPAPGAGGGGQTMMQNPAVAPLNNR